MQQAQTPPVPVTAYREILHTATFSDGVTRLMSERVPTPGFSRPDNLFVGHAVFPLSVHVRDPQTGGDRVVERPEEIEFPVDGDSVEEAWRNYLRCGEEEIPKAIEKIVAKLNQQANSKIVVPKGPISIDAHRGDFKRRNGRA